MRVRRLAWVGIPTERYNEMRQFLVEDLGLEIQIDETSSVEVSLDGGDRVQLFGPGSEYFSFYAEQGARIVPLFEVDDVDQARETLLRAGATVVRDGESDRAWRWLHVRAPDGNLLAFASRR